MAGFAAGSTLILSAALRFPEVFLVSGSLSRLSNVAKRLEDRGWMERTPDPDDGRYTLAILTDAGYEVVVAAARVHVRAVRDLVLNPLTKADRQALARIAAKLRIRPTDLD